MSDERPEDVLVISFGNMSITNNSLEQLMLCCPPDSTWRYLAVPEIGRDRLLAAIEKAIADMSDEYGRVIPELPDFETFVNSLDDESGRDAAVED